MTNDEQTARLNADDPARMRDKDFDALSVPECMEYLAMTNVGRLAYVDTVGVLPLIEPVNFLLHEDLVVFRTAPGSKLTAAVVGSPVAFEVDGINEHNRTGWSVVIRGHAEEVTDQAELEPLKQSPLIAWAPGIRSHYVRIRPRQVTGRRISLASSPSNWWG